MRLLTYQQAGEERIGCLMQDRVLDLKAACDIYYQHKGTGTPPAAKEAFKNMLSLLDAGKEGFQLASQLVSHFASKGSEEIEKSGVTQPLDGITIKAPIPRPRKIIATGLNYIDHINECAGKLSFKVRRPDIPYFFAKFPCNVIGPNERIIYPKLSGQLDYEGELAFIVGKTGRNIPLEQAERYLAGYTVANDVSAREVQFNEDRQFTMGKNFHTFCPLGPYLVTPDEIPDVHNLDLKVWVDGELRQNSNTKNLLFNIPFLVSHYSKIFVLEPGDVILTGTPGGVGVFLDPPGFLAPGNKVTIDIAHVGRLENSVVEE